jgi:hypothetical protein
MGRCRDWFILFDGVSQDGCGTPTFKAKTYDEYRAKTHAKKCRDNPYSAGYSQKITMKGITRL